MGQYRSISVSFWTDTKVYDEFDWCERYLYIYLLTNAHTNICGCYEISKKQIAQETGLSKADLERALYRLEYAHKVLRYAGATKEVLILNWSRYNWSGSDKLKSAVLAVGRHIKCPEFRSFVLDRAETIGKQDCKQDSKTDGKKESNKERIVTDIVTDTVTDLVTDTDTDTVSELDVSIGYGYPIDTLSEAEKKEEGKKAEGDDFERLWKAYPAKRRYGKDTCREAFGAVSVPIDTLLTVLEQQKASENWTKDGGKYIPGLIKWITEARWEDWQPSEPAKETPAGGYSMSESEIRSVQDLARRRKKSH